MSGKVAQPSTHFWRPDRCAENGHPGGCFNPWMDQTVCVCGLIWGAGNTVDIAALYAEPMWSTEPRPNDWQRPLPGPVGAHCVVPAREPVQLDRFEDAA